MGKNILTTVLTVALVAAALLTTWFAVFSWKNARELRKLQLQANFIASQQNVLRALVSDSVEYSRRHPEIVPILKSVGVNPQAESK